MSPKAHTENSLVDNNLLFNTVPMPLVSLLFVEAGEFNTAFPELPTPYPG